MLSQGDVERLADVLSEESAQKLVEAWRAVAEEAGVVSFLDDHGFDIRLANKVRKIWPEDALTKLRENPYRMLAFAGWEKVDRMARSLGVALDDPRRQVAAVEACLYRRLDAKHTLTSHAMLLDGVCGAMGTRSTGVARAAVDLRSARARDRRHWGWLPASWGRRDGKEPSRTVSASCWLAFPDRNGICFSINLLVDHWPKR